MKGKAGSHSMEEKNNFSIPMQGNRSASDDNHDKSQHRIGVRKMSF